MKRRDFGLLAGAGLVAPYLAKADTAQLDAMLTPLGAERAGNADGSIPAWDGGLSGAALAAETPVVPDLFAGERPLYVVNQDNMQQYAALLSDGTQRMVERAAMSLHVYQTRRTAAAPQYVYDNTARNMTRAQLDPKGGRLGFTGAVGGAPFPVIDTADAVAGGAQLIWNHLTAWNGASMRTAFMLHHAMRKGKLSLANGRMVRALYPYYQPDISLDEFVGYYSKFHTYDYAVASPAAQAADTGVETIVWHSTDMSMHPDIVWTLLSSQGRVRKAPTEQYGAPNAAVNGIGNLDENAVFSGNPSQYDWRYIGKQEMLVPYNCNGMRVAPAAALVQPGFPNPDLVRWEKHRVWVVEAVLRPEMSNVNARRRLYIDEDTWHAVLGESYDSSGNMVKAYAMYNECVPSLPGVIRQADAVFDLQTGDYALSGAGTVPGFAANIFSGWQDASVFEPQQSAASPCF